MIKKRKKKPIYSTKPWAFTIFGCFVYIETPSLTNTLSCLERKKIKSSLKTCHTWSFISCPICDITKHFEVEKIFQNFSNSMKALNIFPIIYEFVCLPLSHYIYIYPWWHVKLWMKGLRTTQFFSTLRKFMTKMSLWYLFKVKLKFSKYLD